MKNFLMILVLNIFFIGNAYADSSIVFYCSDDLVTGMDGEYKSSQKYKAERFNVKFDTLDQSEIIVDGDIFKKTGNDVLNIYIDDIGSMIRFYSFKDKKIEYHRSRIFGMSDAIYVANGTCESF